MALEIDTQRVGGVISGPGSSTDNAIVRWDGTGGGTLQDSGILIDDTDNVTGVGSLTLASDIIHTGDTNNKIAFTTDTQTFQTGGSTRMDINDSGIQLGGSGARVTTVLDEDAMGSDSATALSTQQSIKAYVDSQVGGATTALDNLASVALNTALLPDAAAADDFGSATLPFKDIFLAGSSGTPGTNNFKLTGASTSGTRTITLPDATDTLVGKDTTDTLTNKTIDTANNTITVVEADISDLGSYITASSTDTLTNKTFDANGTGNSLSNVETADIAAGSKSGADATLITGTAGTDGDLAQWNADGDLVDGPTPPTGTIVGTTDTQTLTNKDLTATSNSFTAASATQAGVVELATTGETDTGTDTGRAVTPDGLAGSIYGKKYFPLKVVADDTELTTGDGKIIVCLPTDFAGMNLVDVEGYVTTNSSSGDITVQVRNVTQAADILSTALTIDANERHSDTAATAAVIDTAEDDYTANDLIAIDIDSAGTGSKGLGIILVYATP